ncbi:MAG: hypothetical protein QSU88_07900, partial [Candidatus Methanoperedens sp.]|nr:hypothetical protein [Candidatus Methanoperedens sp.]
STGSLPLIETRKQEQGESGFFAVQQKGMLKKLFDVSISKVEKQLQEDKKKQESDYIWKKSFKE